MAGSSMGGDDEHGSTGLEDGEGEEDDQPFIDLSDPNNEIVDDGEGQDDEPMESDGEQGEEDGAEEGSDEDDMPESTPSRDDAIMILRGHTSPVHALGCHPNRPYVVTGGEDDIAIIWRLDISPPVTDDASTSTNTPVVHILRGHSDTVVDAAFTFDGALAVTGSLDSTVRLWSVETGIVSFILEDLTGGIEWILPHPSGGVVFAGSSDGQSALWNTKGQCMQIFVGQTDKITCGRLVGENRWLATGSADGSIRVFNPKTAETVCTFDSIHHGVVLPSEEVTCLEVCPSPHSDTVLAGYLDGTLAFLGLGLLGSSGKKVHGVVKQHSEAIENIRCCAAPFPWAASCGCDSVVCIWDLPSMTVRSRINLPAGAVQLRWFRDTTHILLACLDGAVRQIDARSPDSAETRNDWLGHRMTVLNFAIFGDRLVSTSDDHTVRVFAL